VLTCARSLLQLNSEEEEIADAAAQIVRSKAILKQKSQAKHISRAIIPRKAKNVTLKQFTTGMREIGLDPKHLERRAAVLGEKEKAAYEAYVKRQEAKEAAEGGVKSTADGDVEMQDVAEGPSGSARGVSARGPKTNRQFAGMATDAVRFRFRFLFSSPFTSYSCPTLYLRTASNQGRPSTKVRRPRTQQDGQGFRIRSSYSDHEAEMDDVGKEKAGYQRQTLSHLSPPTRLPRLSPFLSRLVCFARLLRGFRLWPWCGLTAVVVL
jgi:hypothetical protein